MNGNETALSLNQDVPPKSPAGVMSPCEHLLGFGGWVSYLGGGTYLGRAPRGLLLCKLHAPLQREGGGASPPSNSVHTVISKPQAKEERTLSLP